VQKFVGQKHRCRSDLKAHSQATNTIQGSPTARIDELSEQQQRLHNHEVNASHSVRFGAA
jgi:hypothetical protein